jgi:small ligand-binding sensory domain FIST
MNFAAAISTAADPEAAVHDVIEQVRPYGSAFSLATIFYTPKHNGDADSIAQTLIETFSLPCLIGCSCEGVIGAGREIEKGPALSVLFGNLPGASASAFHISKAQWDAALADDEGFADHFQIKPDTRAVLAMGDPWTTPLYPVLDQFDAYRPSVPLIGGMASGATQAGKNVLLFNDARFDEGMVGFSISGQVRVEAVVSQGCRPIGRAFVITRGQSNVIEQLGGRPALEVLQEVVDGLSESDRQMLSQGLLLGRAMDEYKDTLKRGDFVMRNVIGIDNTSKHIAVGDRVRVGQTIQFHARDAATADEELKLLLASRQTARPAGAMLFSCNGRGTRLFASADHDAHVAAEQMPDVPVVGFFAAGELGPVGGKNFIHAHTASFALFSER